MISVTSDKRLSIDVDVSNMSEEEVLLFESVLNRNDAINSMELNRVRRLKNSTATTRNRTPSVPVSPPTTTDYTQCQEYVCQRCGSLDPSVTAVCRICRSILCRQCWGSSPDNRLKICASCYQRIVLDAKTGTWFHQQVKNRSPNQASLQGDPSTPERLPTNHCNRQSPKKNLLRRLRSYGSMVDELDNCMENLGAPGELPGNNISHDDRTLSPSFFINSEDEGDQTRLDDGWSVTSASNYYRPLAYIGTNPIKASSNGCPISADEADTEQWHRDDEKSDIVIPARVPEPGEVLIELDFNFRMSQFIVVLRQCRNLPIADHVTKSICPYLFILLLPDRSKKSRRTTSVKKNTLTPSYDQIFKYSINFTELESRSLLVMLCHKDDHSTRDLALGQVIISLSFIEFSKPLIRWYPFQLLGTLAQPLYERPMSCNKRKRSNIPPYLGEISLALKFVRNQSQTDSPGELHVWIKSMRNIALHQWSSSPSAASSTTSRRYSVTEDNGSEETTISNGLSLGSSRLLDVVLQLGLSPPVARVCLLPYRRNTQTTEPARPSTSNRTQFTWSSILKFPSVDLEELRTRSMEVTVWVHSRHGWLNKLIQAKCMGGVRLSRGLGVNDSGPGTNSRGVSTGIVEERMWTAMVERPNTWIDGTVKLKMEASFLMQVGTL